MMNLSDRQQWVFDTIVEINGIDSGATEEELSESFFEFTRSELNQCLDSLTLKGLIRSTRSPNGQVLFHPVSSNKIKR